MRNFPQPPDTPYALLSFDLRWGDDAACAFPRGNGRGEVGRHALPQRQVPGLRDHAGRGGAPCELRALGALREYHIIRILRKVRSQLVPDGVDGELLAGAALSEPPLDV